MKRILKTTLTLCLLMLMAACAPLDMSTEELAARIQESMDNGINVHLIQETHFMAPDGTEGVGMGGPELHIQETWMRDAQHSRHESRSPNQPEHDMIFIQNGDQNIMVNLAENSYANMDFHLDEGEEMERPSAAEMIAEGLENLDITYLGEEEVAGRMTYKVTASPKEDASGEFMMMGVGTMTMWVDQETFYPLQNEYDMGGGAKAFTKATFVEFGVEMPDELFLPPAGAVEVEQLPGMPESLTIEEAQARADFDMLSLPASSEFELESAMVMTAEDIAKMMRGASDEMPMPTEGTDVALMYTASRKFLHISQSSMERPEMPEGIPVPDGMEPVTVRGHEGEMMTHFGSTNLSWTENGIRFNMGGPNLSLEELLELAESLE